MVIPNKMMKIHNNNQEQLFNKTMNLFMVED